MITMHSAFVDQLEATILIVAKELFGVLLSGVKSDLLYRGDVICFSIESDAGYSLTEYSEDSLHELIDPSNPVWDTIIPDLAGDSTLKNIARRE